jgi:hypothetical protein
MKRLTTLLLFLISISLTAWSQKPELITNEFVVTGQIKKELKFGLTDFEKYTSKPINDVVITNHLGEPRRIAKQLSGIPVKDLLKDIELNEESPKRFSEFYFTFIASDNYKVVYSWNEIFNSPTGDNLLLITSQDGKKIKDMTERILTLTPTDFKTGRRHIKGLSKIVVSRVE